VLLAKKKIAFTSSTFKSARKITFVFFLSFSGLGSKIFLFNIKHIVKISGEYFFTQPSGDRREEE
jgi:hypothetical protein